MRKNLHIGGGYLEVRHQPDGQRRAQIILEGISGVQRKIFRIQTTGEKFAYRVRVGGYGTQANARVPAKIPYILPLVNSKPHKKRALVGSFSLINLMRGYVDILHSSKSFSLRLYNHNSAKSLKSLYKGVH